MAGHSKFKNIMHRKGAQDAKRAKRFTKIIKEITVAARTGNPDPSMNPRLRTALAEARVENVSKDTIERAIKKATEANTGENFEEIRYEGYGVKGVAVIVEALTDNRNRTASDVRSTFSKYGGSLGEMNSVSFMFSRVGQILYPLGVGSVDTVFEAATEAGAENVESSDDAHEITCAVEDFYAVRDALEKALGSPAEAALVWIPQTTVALDEEAAISVLKLIDVLEDNDDVRSVSANFDIAPEVLVKLAG